MSDLVADIIRQHKQGRRVGIPSLCTAHPLVLEAAARLSAREDTLLLIESTCNQVNQDGGYMGMVPEQFVSFAQEICARIHLPVERLALGGDHLGPYPWRRLPARQALEKAHELVQAYVQAGYTKIHLDASMPLGGDPAILPVEIAAQRTAELCTAAEEAAARSGGPTPYLLYVIGSEVPTPGGIVTEDESLQVTQVESVAATLAATREVFTSRSLETAWQRVIALVVQPGIEFGDRVVFPYERSKANSLTRFIENDERLVFEAHSTDYQRPEILNQLVEDHFAILKVGPALTFVFREAVFALSNMEAELLQGKAGMELSRLPEVLEEVMLGNPINWEPYYRGDETELRLARKYSYSDRSRYYWTDPRLQTALRVLFKNLETIGIPETLLSQYLPAQYARLREGLLGSRPVELVMDYIADAILPYQRACAGN